MSAIKANISIQTQKGRFCAGGGGVVESTGGWVGWGGVIKVVVALRRRRRRWRGVLLMKSPLDSYIKRGRLNNRGDVNDIRTADPGH